MGKVTDLKMSDYIEKHKDEKGNVYTYKVFVFRFSLEEQPVEIRWKEGYGISLSHKETVAVYGKIVRGILKAEFYKNLTTGESSNSLKYDRMWCGYACSLIAALLFYLFVQRLLHGDVRAKNEWAVFLALSIGSLTLAVWVFKEGINKQRMSRLIEASLAESTSNDPTEMK